VESERTSIAERLEQARSRIRRFTPDEAAAAQADGAVIVDTRDSADRLSEGIIPNSILVTRNTLEWRADPTADTPHPVLSDLSSELIVACNDGFSSSLAADSLRQLGHTTAGDIIGGYRAWKAAGLPTNRAPERDDDDQV
jgi:rhodanese-related sulfurtransferase